MSYNVAIAEFLLSNDPTQLKISDLYKSTNKLMAKKDTDKFKFRRHSTIGAAAAEEDDRFLNACFLDTGDLETLLDCKDPRRIVLGRADLLP